MTDIFTQLYELNEQLSDNEMWITILENTFYERGVNDLAELIENSVDGEDENAIYSLVDEGESLLLIKNQALEDWFDEDNDYGDEW